ncbi:hypothetical protein [Actinotalea sp. C106]|uniref:hypothetical protein n=1 Tax=Actinotalea sp. C106 TaxID=2908644 RepID=UPI002027F97D|nr:hypothetical protein [Actinotalea sp. C106]
MSWIDSLSLIFAFLGAGIGAGLAGWFATRTSRDEQRGRRFEAALELLTSHESRQRALGRARVVQVARQGSPSDPERQEAMAVLREDVRVSCSGEVLTRLAAQLAGEEGSVRIAGDVTDARVVGPDVLVGPSLVDTAQAYVDIAGGSDAAGDQLVVLIAQAEPQVVRSASDESPVRARVQTEARSGSSEGLRGRAEGGLPLPTDRRLILVKLNAEVESMTPAELKERARKAWVLSLPRVRGFDPEAVVAVVRQEVRGAWRFRDVHLSDEPGRVEFDLGEEVPDLIGREFLDTGQNPVRYWP